MIKELEFDHKSGQGNFVFDGMDVDFRCHTLFEDKPLREIGDYAVFQPEELMNLKPDYAVIRATSDLGAGNGEHTETVVRDYSMGAFEEKEGMGFLCDKAYKQLTEVIDEVYSDFEMRKEDFGADLGIANPEVHTTKLEDELPYKIEIKDKAAEYSAKLDKDLLQKISFRPEKCSHNQSGVKWRAGNANNFIGYIDEESQEVVLYDFIGHNERSERRQGYS